MPSSPSHPVPKPAAVEAMQRWALTTAGAVRGVALAREKGWALAWDDHGWLYLVNGKGERQGQFHSPGPLAAACCADDGSAFAAVGLRGEVRWLGPDLMPRWQHDGSPPAVAAALDPFGRYLAVSDVRGRLRVFDREGRSVCRGQTPRPLHHLAFVPEAPLLLGCADLGLVACFDLSGQCLWRDGLVASVGSLAVSGGGDRVVLACYSEGLRFYTATGQKQGQLALAEPCRLALLTFDGRLTLVVGVGNRLLLLDRTGQTVATPTVEHPVVAAAFGPLGTTLVAALADGRVVGLDLRPGLS